MWSQRLRFQGFFLQRSYTRFPNFEKNKQKIFKTYTKASDGA